MLTGSSENFDIRHTPSGIRVQDNTGDGLIHIKIKCKQYITPLLFTILMAAMSLFIYKLLATNCHTPLDMPDPASMSMSMSVLNARQARLCTQGDFILALLLIFDVSLFIFFISRLTLSYTIKIDKTSRHFVITTRNKTASAIEFTPENTEFIIQVVTGNGGRPTNWRRIEVKTISNPKDDLAEDDRSLLPASAENEPQKLSDKTPMPLVSMDPLTKSQAEYVEQLLWMLLGHGPSRP